MTSAMQESITKFIVSFMKNENAAKLAEKFQKEKYQDKLKEIITELMPKKKLKDPNAPKRPKSGYQFFSTKRRPELKEEGVPGKDMMSTLGAEWSALGDDEKAPFLKLAEKEKKKYEKAKAAYVKPSDEELAELPINQQSPKRKRKSPGEKKEKKDPNAPKGAKTAYMFFQQEKRAALKEQKVDNDTIKEEIKKGWERLKEKKKTAKYDELAKQDKERYKEELAQYEKIHGKIEKKPRGKKGKKSDDESDSKSDESKAEEEDTEDEEEAEEKSEKVTKGKKEKKGKKSDEEEEEDLKETEDGDDEEGPEMPDHEGDFLQAPPKPKSPAKPSKTPSPSRKAKPTAKNPRPPVTVGSDSDSDD